ncbi:MAG: YdeI/OmpD-associated family protein [Bacteroidota bacterium]
MAQLNKKVTEYISNSAEFAQGIMEHLRQIIHETCPDAEEDIKWGTPHYSYKGDHLCMMGGFKNHCSFSLYKAEFIKDKEIMLSVKAGKKFGYMDKLKSIADLPSKKILVSLLKEAMTINEKGIKKEKPVSDKPKLVETPDYLIQRLSTDPKAKEIFNTKSNSFRKEYIVWISDAKTDETRQKRLAEAMEWIAEGKSRFWKSKK